MQRGITFDERDLFRNPLSLPELRSLLNKRSAADIFSWRSPRVRQLSVGIDATDDELLSLMAQEPYLIRRPLITVGDNLIIGFAVEQLAALLDPR